MPSLFALLLKGTSYFSAILLASYSCAYGAELKKHFDIINYAPPPGWQHMEESGFAFLEKTDRFNNQVCAIGVFASARSSGDVSKDFLAEWRQLVESRAIPDSAPVVNVRNQSATGGIYVTDKSSKARYFSALTILLRGDAALPIRIVSPTEESLNTCMPDVESFFKSIEFVSQGQASGERAASSSSAQATGPEEITIDSVTGKWGSSSPTGDVYHRYEFRPNHTWRLAWREAGFNRSGIWTGYYIERHEQGTFQIAGGYIRLWTNDDPSSPAYDYRAWFIGTSLCLLQRKLFDGLNGPDTRDYKLCYERMHE